MWAWLSPFIIAAVVADVVAQGTKITIAILQGRMTSWRGIFKSGRMPSAHTAAMVSLATTIGVIEGLDTAVFALSAFVALFMGYDAMRVRRATGEQGEAVDAIINASKRVKDDRLAREIAKIDKPYFARGHRPTEVLVGGIIGIVVGLTVAFFATR